VWNRHCDAVCQSAFATLYGGELPINSVGSLDDAIEPSANFLEINDIIRFLRFLWSSSCLVWLLAGCLSMHSRRTLNLTSSRFPSFRLLFPVPFFFKDFGLLV
jgi:hypothetical protein